MGADTETQNGEEKKANALARAITPVVLFAFKYPKFSIPFALLATASTTGLGTTVMNNLSHRSVIHAQVDTLTRLAKADHQLLEDIAEKTRNLYGAFLKINGGQKAMNAWLKEKSDFLEKERQDSIKRALYGVRSGITFNAKSRARAAD
jgi:hypothetical protein